MEMEGKVMTRKKQTKKITQVLEHLSDSFKLKCGSEQNSFVYYKSERGCM